VTRGSPEIRDINFSLWPDVDRGDAGRIRATWNARKLPALVVIIVEGCSQAI